MERARTSRKLFVRSQNQLAEWSEEACGRKLTAWEAHEAFGYDIMREAVFSGAAILLSKGCHPSEIFRSRRMALGISKERLAQQTNLSLTEIDSIEKEKSINSIHKLEQVAIALNLDERLISFYSEQANDEFALRLKSINQEVTSINEIARIKFDDAAWVIRTEIRLKSWLGMSADREVQPRFSRDSNYGSIGYPVWRHGLWLAAESRRKLEIGPDESISGLWKLCETELDIPLVWTELPDDVAGATISSGGTRGIVINTLGKNSNVWVQRATIAHELGHLLFDPANRLQAFKVDSYADLERADTDYTQITDVVEQRANAFGVELLAPQAAVARVFEKSGCGPAGLRAVMEFFGISFTAARFHIWNAFERKIPLPDLGSLPSGPTQQWSSSDEFTLGYFPIRATPNSRRGRFAYLTIMALRAGLISTETASNYLRCAPDELHDSADAILELLR